MTKLMLGDKSYRNIYYRGAKQGKVVLDGLTIFSAPDLSGAPSGPFTEDGDKFYRDTTLGLARGNYETYYNEAKNDCDQQTDGTWLCTDGNLSDGDVNGGTTTGAYDPAFNDDTSGTNSGGSTSGGGSTAPTPGDIAGSANIKTLTGMMNASLGGHDSYNSSHHNRLQIWADSNGDWKQSWCLYADGGPGGYGRTAVATRDFPSGSWGALKDVHSVVMHNATNDPRWSYGETGGVGHVDHDNHNNATMAVASDGTHVVMSNHHASWIHCAVSPAGGPNGTWTNFPRSAFPDDPDDTWLDSDRITYPCLFQFNGDVWFAVRGQKTSGGGLKNGKWWWWFYSFNHTSRTWSHRSTLQYGVGARSYCSNVSVTTMPNGQQRMGIAGNFRNDVEGSDSSGDKYGGKAHYDLYHYYSDDGENWRQYNKSDSGNQAISTPVEFTIPDNGGNNRSNVPVKIWETDRLNDPQVGSFVTGWDANNNPLIFVDSRSDGDIHFSHGSNGWTSVLNPGASGGDDGRYFSLPSGDLAFIWADSNDVKFINMNSSSGANYSSGRLLVDDKNNNNYTIIIDEEAKRYGWLSMVVFKGGVSAPNNGYCVSIPLGELETFNNPY